MTAPDSKAETPAWRCPKCKGAAVRLTQTGELHCVAQCDETLPDTAKRIALEEWNAAMARKLAESMPKGVGFVLVTLNFGDGDSGAMTYASSVDREDCIHVLQELVDKMRSTP